MKKGGVLWFAAWKADHAEAWLQVEIQRRDIKKINFYSDTIQYVFRLYLDQASRTLGRDDYSPVFYLFFVQRYTKTEKRSYFVLLKGNFLEVYFLSELRREHSLDIYKFGDFGFVFLKVLYFKTARYSNSLYKFFCFKFWDKHLLHTETATLTGSMDPESHKIVHKLSPWTRSWNWNVVEFKGSGLEGPL